MDILGEIKGIERYGEVAAQSIVADLRGRTVRMLNLDALIAVKKAMGHPRDQEAVLQLEAIRELKN